MNNIVSISYRSKKIIMGVKLGEIVGYSIKLGNLKLDCEIEISENIPDNELWIYAIIGRRERIIKVQYAIS